MDDLSNEVKAAILFQELTVIKQQIYRLSISAEARKIAGYSDDENRGLLIELERVIKMRDVMTAKMAELQNG